MRQVVVAKDYTPPEVVRRAVDGEVLHEVDEYRPGRNYVRVGDVIKAHPPGKYGYLARLTALYAKADGEVVEFECIGQQGTRAPAVRTFVIDRLERVAQTDKNRERLRK